MSLSDGMVLCGMNIVLLNLIQFIVLKKNHKDVPARWLYTDHYMLTFVMQVSNNNKQGLSHCMPNFPHQVPDPVYH